MTKCIYCNHKTDDCKSVSIGKESFLYCCDECKDKTISFVNYANRTVIFFIIGIISTVILALLPILIPSIVYPLTTIGVVVLGITAIVFPFSTPQTIGLLGIKKSIIVVRIVGMVLIIAALLWYLT